LLDVPQVDGSPASNLLTVVVVIVLFGGPILAFLGVNRFKGKNADTSGASSKSSVSHAAPVSRGRGHGQVEDEEEEDDTEFDFFVDH
jgi:hypothetical protein